MAENGNTERPAAPAGQTISVISQYVKDFSFESPGAPQSLRSRTSMPAIAINVNVTPRPAQGDEIEVELRIDANAREGETTVFAIELVYGGLFRLINIPKENALAVAMIECPRLLFPFARQIISDASRNGGFPPLLIDPIDFMALYRQRAQAAAARTANA